MPAVGRDGALCAVRAGSRRNPGACKSVSPICDIMRHLKTQRMKGRRRASISKGAFRVFECRGCIHSVAATLRSATRGRAAARPVPATNRRHPYLTRLQPPMTSAYDFTMEIPRRKSLPHEIPLWADPEKEIYFISINCQERFRNQLTLPKVAERLFETVRHRQEKFLWWPYVFLLMPDHLHALLSFPSFGGNP